MKTLLIYISLLFISKFTFGQTSSIDQIVINKLCQGILVYKKIDKYFNAELINLYLSEKNINLLDVEKEISNIYKNKESQKKLFDFWYNKFELGVLKIPESREQILTRYFYNNLSLNEDESKILAVYIDKLYYLTETEKKQKLQSFKDSKRNQIDELETQSKTYDLFQIEENSYRYFYRIANQKVFDIIAKDTFSREFRYIKNRIYDSGQINIEVVINFTIERNYIEPSFLTDNSWKNKVPQISVETVLGKEFFEIINFIPSEKFPLTKINGHYVKTKATYQNFRMKISRGVCKVKNSKKSINFIENTPLNEEIKNAIIEKVKSLDKGQYKIDYRVGKVNELSIDEIIILKIN